MCTRRKDGAQNGGVGELDRAPGGEEVGGGGEGGDAGCCPAPSSGLGLFGHLVGRLSGFSDRVAAFGSRLGIDAVVSGCCVAPEADSGMMVLSGWSEGVLGGVG